MNLLLRNLTFCECDIICTITTPKIKSLLHGWYGLIEHHCFELLLPSAQGVCVRRQSASYFSKTDQMILADKGHFQSSTTSRWET